MSEGRDGVMQGGQSGVHSGDLHRYWGVALLYKVAESVEPGSLHQTPLWNDTIDSALVQTTKGTRVVNTELLPSLLCSSPHQTLFPVPQPWRPPSEPPPASSATSTGREYLPQDEAAALGEDVRVQGVGTLCSLVCYPIGKVAASEC